MLKIVFHDRSSALVQFGTERTEVRNQVGVDLISQDVTEAGWAVTEERRGESSRIITV